MISSLDDLQLGEMISPPWWAWRTQKWQYLELGWRILWLISLSEPRYIISYRARCSLLLEEWVVRLNLCILSKCVLQIHLFTYSAICCHDSLDFTKRVAQQMPLIIFQSTYSAKPMPPLWFHGSSRTSGTGEVCEGDTLFLPQASFCREIVAGGIVGRSLPLSWISHR